MWIFYPGQLVIVNESAGKWIVIRQYNLVGHGANEYYWLRNIESNREGYCHWNRMKCIGTGTGLIEDGGITYA